MGSTWDQFDISPVPSHTVTHAPLFQHGTYMPGRVRYPTWCFSQVLHHPATFLISSPSIKEDATPEFCLGSAGCHSNSCPGWWFHHQGRVSSVQGQKLLHTVIFNFIWAPNCAMYKENRKQQTIFSCASFQLFFHSFAGEISTTSESQSRAIKSSLNWSGNLRQPLLHFALTLTLAINLVIFGFMINIGISCSELSSKYPGLIATCLIHLVWAWCSCSEQWVWPDLCKADCFCVFCEQKNAAPNSIPTCRHNCHHLLTKTGSCHQPCFSPSSLLTGTTHSVILSPLLTSHVVHSLCHLLTQAPRHSVPQFVTQSLSYSATHSLTHSLTLSLNLSLLSQSLSFSLSGTNSLGPCFILSFTDGFTSFHSSAALPQVILLSCHSITHLCISALTHLPSSIHSFVHNKHKHSFLPALLPAFPAFPPMFILESFILHPLAFTEFVFLLSFSPARQTAQNLTIEERVLILEAEVTLILADVDEVKGDVQDVEDDVDILFNEQLIQNQQILNLDEDADDLEDDIVRLDSITEGKKQDWQAGNSRGWRLKLYHDKKGCHGKQISCRYVIKWILFLLPGLQDTTSSVTEDISDMDIRLCDLEVQSAD